MCESIFKEWFGTACKDRYDIICAVNDYKIENKSVYDSVRNGGRRPVPKGSTTDVLQYLSFILKFMDTWFKTLD